LEENNKKLRILILSDSTSMWIRPYRNHINDFTYVELLQKEGYSIDIISSPGMTSREVLNIYWNELMANFYDVCIVSVGINDLTPRSYPRWMWKINNSLLVNDTFSAKFYGYFYRIFTNKYIQKTFSKYKLSKPWVSKKYFKLNLLKFQEIVLKESDSKIIYLSLPMVSKRVSSLLCGIDKSVIAYKNEIANLVNNERVFQVDIDVLFQENREKYNEEGIHYTTEGHKKVFGALLNKIKTVVEK